MSAVSVIDFCCGRTQHDTCGKCGRDFHAVAEFSAKRPWQKPRVTTRPALPLFSADFKAGMVIGSLLGAGGALILFASGAWFFCR